MRRVVLLLGVSAAIAACAPADRTTQGDTASAAGTVAVPEAISLSAVAGKWTVKTMPEMSDSVVLTYELVATADTTGWTITFPGRPAIPLHVMPPMGDSIVAHAGPFESALRKGVMVNSTSVVRLRDGKLIGTVLAKYLVTTADSIGRFRTEGTRM